MDIRVVRGDITQQATDAIVVNLFEGVTQPSGATGAVDKALGGLISTLISEGECKGKKGQMTLVHTFGRIPAKRVLVVGLGKQQEFTLDTVRQVSAEACRFLKEKGVRRAATVVHGAGIGGLSSKDAATALTEGALLGTYTFTRLKAPPKDETTLQSLDIVESSPDKIPAVQEGVELGKVLAEATALCRDLVNEPANHLTPTRLAEVARSIATQHGLTIEVLDREQCEALGMGSFLAVARGSHQPPKFIILSYQGDPAHPDNNLGLLGKGITFDSGGISLKPAERMEEMKGDMAGGAAVLCAVKAIAALKVPINVTAIVPATENMPGGGATKPGDVVKAMNGKSIEIINTDAEGRLVLADAVCYARQRLGLKRLVDLATLTGAIVVALGNLRAGLFTNNQAWADMVFKASERSGERLWQMPMDTEYRDLIRSDVADIRNVSSGRGAGSIVGAYFIREFVEDTPWVHLDIAGTFLSDKDSGYYVKGGTGFGVRTLVHLALLLAENQAKRV
ncbi:MAG: leucyl aminopeptidase [Dehalococcoidia bacterium]|nr:leucyl aminopeptidase [Dehalococcoidia bacterium]MDW8119139.1 leucyl aminopeptidase [Chloroflexota bacterium]